MASALLAGTVAGPIVGFAAVAALNSFADSRWLYFTAAGLAIVTAGWLFYRVADEEIPVARPRRARPALAPMLSGVVWSAANVAFIALNAGNRGEALWLIVAQIPGMLILANANERVRTGLAVALAVVAGVSLTRFLLPQALADWLNPTFLTWLGAFCMGGTLAAVPDCWRAPPSRALAGFSLGVLLSLALISAVAWIAVDAVRPVALTGTLAALLVLFVARRSAWGRMR
jgi:MFS family permease